MLSDFAKNNILLKEKKRVLFLKIQSIAESKQVEGNCFKYGLVLLNHF